YSATVADLSGYYLTQDLTNKTKFQIPAGYTIPPHGFLLVWADKKSSANSPGAPDLHANFKLTKTGDSIALFTPDGIMVDAISFTNLTSDISQGRYPDSSPNIFDLASPSPRQPNTRPPNHPPVLAPIPDRVLHAGMMLSFTSVGADGDVPPNVLTYSLSNAPFGAIIGADNGVFAWTPTDAHVRTTNLITVILTDDGSPPMSDQQTFAVIVQARPGLKVGSADGKVTLAWSAIPGQTYRVQQTEPLNPPDWRDVPDDVIAAGDTVSITYSVDGIAQRFYRILILR
ncbi:MAG: lamin tail domain-containing protein, partial [Verrucomicrobia bacterium]|nr:lamin tail domain-containing protein [Verrucomicrobiota bacterium]